MTMPEKRLSNLASLQDSQLALDRTLLKDRAAEALREFISGGRIPEGTKLTESEVSRLLGISRAPARDALMALEAEGLVVTRSNGRYVIELNAKDVSDIHALRATLERMAVRQAAAARTAAGVAELEAALYRLEEAIGEGDAHRWARADMDLHRTIWQMAGNAHLIKVLDSMLGVIQVLAAREKGGAVRHPELDLENHRRLVRLIVEGHGDRAADEVEAQIDSALRHALKDVNEDNHAR